MAKKEGRNRRQHGASIRAPENRSAARFLGRGAAGAAGEAASIARRLPWRLDATSARQVSPFLTEISFVSTKEIS